MREFLHNCKKLTALRLSSAVLISDGTMAVLGRDFPALRELRVKSRSIVTRHIAHWPLLEVLEVTYMSDKALRELAAHCPRLRVLKAERCQLVTDSGVVALAKGCPLLQTAYFQENIGLNIAADKAIRSCRFLKR
jgi:hypothetical protein